MKTQKLFSNMNYFLWMAFNSMRNSYIFLLFSRFFSSGSSKFSLTPSNSICFLKRIVSSCSARIVPLNSSLTPSPVSYFSASCNCFILYPTLL
eukprot:UN11766